MHSTKIEGVILKRKDFGEADRILTIFTLQTGKISVIAKGVRRINSRRGGNVELLNHGIFFLHQTKGMPILTEAKTVNTFAYLKSNLTLSTYAFHVIELIDKLTAENQENPLIFDHLIKVLENLSDNPRQILIRAFEVKLLTSLGFADYLSGQSELLFNLQTKNWSDINQIEMHKNEARILDQFLNSALEKVLEGQLKSRQILKQVV